MTDRTHLNEDELNEYLDGVLDTSQAAASQTHLAACAGCAARLAKLRVLYAALEALPEEPLRRDIAPAVLAALPAFRASPAMGQPMPAGWRLALAVQAAVALVAVALALPYALGGLPTVAALPGTLVAPFLDFWGEAASVLAESIRLLSQAPRLASGGLAPALDSVFGPWPMAVWLGLIVGLAGFGLAGNGLLLGLARGREPHSRRSEWMK